MLQRKRQQQAALEEGFAAQRKLLVAMLTEMHTLVTDQLQQHNGAVTTEQHVIITGCRARPSLWGSFSQQKELILKVERQVPWQGHGYRAAHLLQSSSGGEAGVHGIVPPLWGMLASQQTCACSQEDVSNRSKAFAAAHAFCFAISSFSSALQ